MTVQPSGGLRQLAVVGAVAGLEFVLAGGAHAQDSFLASPGVAGATVSIWALALFAAVALAATLRRWATSGPATRE
jgi:hypothetical protein